MLIRHIFLLFLVIFVGSFCKSAMANEKLIFAIDVIRHGDRTPIINLPRSPYNWKQDKGELSPLGMQQEFQLGRQFNKRYIQTHFLPLHYNSQLMYVRSSDFNRTLMSAESVLLGLYPLGSGLKLPHSNRFALPGAYQPIPIHTLPMNEDDVLITDSNKPLYYSLLHDYLTQQPTWQALNQNIEFQLPHLTQITGYPFKDTQDFLLLSDHLLIRQLHHIPFPSEINNKEANKIISEGKQLWISPFYSSSITHVLSYKLIKQIQDYIDQSTSPSPSLLKYVLYSAHDSTVASLAGALGHPVPWVPFSSDLAILLYQLDNKHYQVRFYLNDQPLTIPACENKPFCSLEEFNQLAHLIESDGKAIADSYKKTS